MGNDSASSVRLPGQDERTTLSDTGRSYWRSVARIGVQVADAIVYAHAQGVLHRDLKPSNLLLDTQGTVWVTDFGLAKATDSDDLTHSGDIVGTLAYLAPERLRGRSDECNDIYGLGATLYELITLHPPFEDIDRSHLLRRISQDDPSPPRHLEPDVPRDLETIVLKAIDKDPGRRYSSAATMAEDLRRFLADRPIQARRSTVWERSWRLLRRNPLVVSLTAAIVLLTVVLAVGGSIASLFRSQRDQAIRNLTRAERAENNAQANLQRAQQAEREVKIRAHLTQAALHRRRGEIGRRVKSVREIDQALALAPRPSSELQSELRNELIASLALTDVWPTKEWACPRSVMEVDRAFEKYARATRDGVISVRRVDDDQELVRLVRPPGPDPRITLKFSPDGQYLASFTYDRHLVVWHLARGGEVLIDAHCAWEFGYDFTPDSRRLITARNREVVVFDLTTAQEVSRWPTSFTPWCVACSPDGQRLAIAPFSTEPPHALQVLSCSTGQLEAELTVPAWIFFFAWHPDGKSLALSQDDATIHLWDVGQPKPHRELKGAIGSGLQLAFSHDGRLLASCGWSQRLQLWEPLTGERLLTVNARMEPLRFSSNDCSIGVFHDGANVGFYEVIRSDVYRLLAREAGSGHGPPLTASFSPDGRLLAVGARHGIAFWDFATGRPLASAPIGEVYRLRFDDAGQLLTGTNVLNRWSVHVRREAPSHVRVGPPEQLPISLPSGFDVSRNGRVLAIAQFDGAKVIHFDRSNEPVLLRPHEDCRFVAVSRDGKWVATASHWGASVKVWDAASGALAATLPVEGGSWAEFSPDGRWLATSGGGCRIWEVGTWDERSAIGGGPAEFAPDASFLVHDTAFGSLRLVVPETGRELARLEDPNGFGSTRFAFTHDGSALLAMCGTGSSGIAWDLRRIREELASRGLDWELPPYPPPESVQPPIEVELDWADPASIAPEELARASIARYQQAYDASPDDAAASNDLAWALATAPEGLRRVTQAVQLAEKSVERKPDNVFFKNTLGVAYYRAGRYQEAVDCLALNLSAQEDAFLAMDLYFLAMSYHQLGESDSAQTYLTWANRWSDSRPSGARLSAEHLTELAMFRAEAEALIGK
jgi:WD40 repeat protein